MKLVRRRHPHPEIPLVSTADVSFLLLIFFLSTATLSVERGILLGLPSRGEGKVLVRPDRVARVSVLEDRSVALEGRPLGSESLRNALASRVAADPMVLVQLTIASGAPYASVIEALDVVKRAGVRNIALGMETGS
jgi:biopolymer transport protein ExbD